MVESRAENMKIEKPVQIGAGILAEEVAQVIRAGRLIGIFLQVRPDPVEEKAVAQVAPQGMGHHTAFVIDMGSVCQVGRHGGEGQVTPFADVGIAEHFAREAAHVVACCGFTVKVFPVKCFAPAGPAFVQPHIGIRSTGNLIAKPHVRQLMGIEPFIGQAAVDTAIRIGNVFGMLHGPQGSSGETDPLKGVRPETGFINMRNLF